MYGYVSNCMLYLVPKVCASIVSRRLFKEKLYKIKFKTCILWFKILSTIRNLLKYEDFTDEKLRKRTNRT
jgi:hypothetical protein